MLALAGKAIAITGAGRGLGAAYARLAAEHGARVVVNDIDREVAEAVAAEIKSAGGEALAHASDICTWEGAQSLTDACFAGFGRIDGLCNNAAVFWMAAALEEDPAQVERMIRVNLLGTAFAGLAAARAMARQGHGGVILNTTSGAQSGSPGMTSYGASKGGVASLTYGWAAEFAANGIRVNAISPLAHTRTAISIDPGLHSDKPPEHVATVAVFLLSDLSSAVNGQVVFVAGDELAFITHPAVSMPGVVRAEPTVEAVQAAFANGLAARQLPVGRSRQRVEVIGESDRFDAK